MYNVNRLRSQSHPGSGPVVVKKDNVIAYTANRSKNCKFYGLGRSMLGPSPNLKIVVLLYKDPEVLKNILAKIYYNLIFCSNKCCGSPRRIHSLQLSKQVAPCFSNSVQLCKFQNPFFYYY